MIELEIDEIQIVSGSGIFDKLAILDAVVEFGRGFWRGVQDAA